MNLTRVNSTPYLGACLPSHLSDHLSTVEPLLHYEDLEPGMTFPLGPMAVTAADIIAYAGEFDPQPMHLDEEAGKASILGGLAASGWHSCAMLMAMMAQSYVLRCAAEGAPGVDFVRWKKPVLAGDTLEGETTVLSRRVMRSRPHLGMIKLHHVVRNQLGETVLESENPFMIHLRHPAEAGEA